MLWGRYLVLSHLCPFFPASNSVRYPVLHIPYRFNIFVHHGRFYSGIRVLLSGIYCGMPCKKIKFISCSFGHTRVWLFVSGIVRYIMTGLIYRLHLIPVMLPLRVLARQNFFTIWSIGMHPIQPTILWFLSGTIYYLLYYMFILRKTHVFSFTFIENNSFFFLPQKL